MPEATSGRVYAHKDASFFAYPSSWSLRRERQAMFAGAAEWLSRRFGLPQPAWTDDPHYLLAEPWSVWEMEFGEDECIEQHLAESQRLFRKRNVACLGRYLIAL